MKRLIKQVEASTWTWEGEVQNLWALTTNGDWEVLSASANTITAISKLHYIDLAGMSQREKTMFLKGLRIDYQVVPSMTDAVVGDYLDLAFLVTDKPSTRQSFVGPGFSYSDMNAENCALFQQDIWKTTVDTSAWSSYTQMTARVQHGMMESTASDRIYFRVYMSVGTRKIGPATSTLTNVTVPGFRLVLDVDAKEEPEFQYLMRLRRSYELQQQPDVD